MTASPATRSVLLTPPGTGAIAVVHVVGAHADEIISKAFRPTDGDHASGQAGRIHYGTLNRGEEVLDDVLVCRLAGQPEPVWEVCSHGGVRVVQRIIEVFSALGAPLDTAAASRADGAPNRGAIEKDALAALARVPTVAGLQFLAWQRAHLDDALRGLAERWTTDSGGVLAELRQMIARARQARVLLNGADVAIIGPPNAGKSTLLNRLLGRAAAVVSSTPGTTRDWVGAEIEIQGVPLRLIDTAGRRVSEASIECEAIQRGVAATREADLSLVVLDATCAPDTDYMDELCVQISPGRAIVVINKMDLVRQDTKNVAQGVAPLPGASPVADGRGTLRPEANQAGGLAAEQPPALRDGSQSDLRGWAQAAGATLVSISAKTGSGVAALGDAMVGALGVDGNLVGLPAFFCDRQVAMAQRCVGGDDPPLGDRADMIRRLIIGL